jgi:hypothetical protein
VESLAKSVTLNAGRIGELVANQVNQSVNQQILIDTVKLLTTRIDASKKNQRAEMQQVKADVRQEVNILWSEVVTMFNTSDSKMDQRFVGRMAAIAAMSAVAKPITPAPAQLQLQPQTPTMVPSLPPPSLPSPAYLILFQFNNRFSKMSPTCRHHPFRHQRFRFQPPSAVAPPLTRQKTNSSRLLVTGAHWGVVWHRFAAVLLWWFWLCFICVIGNVSLCIIVFFCHCVYCWCR